MSRAIFDCLKRERDICVKTMIPSQNTPFMLLNEQKTLERANGQIKSTGTWYSKCKGVEPYGWS